MARTGRAQTFAALTSQADARDRSDPMASRLWTNAQRDFLLLPDRLAMWRGPNKIGKSLSVAAKVALAARGRDPVRQRWPAPLKILLVGESIPQMDELLGLLWSLLPRHEIDPQTNYVPGQGLTGYRNPHIRLVDGPGKGSTIYVKTYGQRGRGIAGGKYHLAVLDEPPPEGTFGEVLGRIGSPYFGDLRLNFTPTLDSHDVSYLREQAEAGKIRDFNPTALTLDAVTPRWALEGAAFVRRGLVPIPWLTRVEVAAIIESYLEIERAMRVEGAWDPIKRGRWITAFTEQHFGAYYPDAGQELTVLVSIDHGAKAGRQHASLIVCDALGEVVWVIDEARSDERTSTAEDAQLVLNMLDRHGWTWKDVNFWIGDRAHGGDLYGNEKSNADLFAELARIIGKSANFLRKNGLRIDVPYKSKNTISRGTRLVNSLFKENRILLNSRCEHLRDGIKAWEGRRDDPNKDPIDTLRYAVERLQDEKILQPTGLKRFELMLGKAS